MDDSAEGPLDGGRRLRVRKAAEALPLAVVAGGGCGRAHGMHHVGAIPRARASMASSACIWVPMMVQLPKAYGRPEWVANNVREGV